RALRERQALWSRLPHVRPRRRSSALGVGHRGARCAHGVARLCAARAAGVIVNAFLAAEGAVLTDPEQPGAGVAHYGDPFREQRARRAGEARAWLADRAVVSVTGDERLGWLDSITSQSLRGLTPGVCTVLLVLDPQGRVEHAAAVVDDGVTTWLIVD